MSVPHQPCSQVSKQPGLKILFKPPLLSPGNTLFVCSLLSLPMIFWTVLFLPDLHPVSRALKVHVDVETRVKARSHRRHASDGLEYISRFFSRWIKQIWYDDLLSKMHLVRFGKAVAPVSSSLQNAFYRMTDFSFCKKKVSSHSKAPEFTNLPLLAKLEISKVRRNGCFQKDWTCARVQAPLVVVLH